MGKLTKMVVESALEGELDDHLGYGKNDPSGRDGGNSRSGHRAKTVLTDTGPVEISVPRDRDSSFEPKMIAKRQPGRGTLHRSGRCPFPLWVSAGDLRSLCACGSFAAVRCAGLPARDAAPRVRVPVGAFALAAGRCGSCVSIPNPRG
jgi:hypothetical protein